MEKETALGNYEYHYELFDNGCTLVSSCTAMCAVGDEEVTKLIGSFLKEDIEHYCEKTNSIKVKVTIKIKKEK